MLEHLFQEALASQTGTVASAAAVNFRCPTAEDVLDAMAATMAAIEALPPCPFAAKMRQEGCDPDKGWVLVLPAACRPDDETVQLPSYVRFSPLFRHATCVWHTLLGRAAKVGS